MVIAVAFRNFYWSNITEMTISFTGEQWRRDVSRNITTLEFEYAVDETIGDGLCCDNQLVWNRVASLDFVSPKVNLLPDYSNSWVNGNLAVNRRVLGPISVPVNVSPRSLLYLRWRMNSSHSKSHYLSIDDFSVTFTY